MRSAVPSAAIRAARLGRSARALTGDAVSMLGMTAAWFTPSGEDPYSRRVALLKRVLPALGIAMLLMIALWPRLAPLWERMRVSYPVIDLRDARELRMMSQIGRASCRERV